jgi:tetrapyrrole methylase family protein / MazG family protein
MPAKKLLELLKVIEKLRSPKGCPWDKKQTHQSLKPYLIEEAYEVLTAIDKKDPELLKEELGDLLLQIVLHAQIASEKKEFAMKDIVNVIKEKMINRHPHVFANTKVKDVKQVWQNWEKIKQQEKNNQKKSFFDGVPRMLPGLYRASKVQKKAARVGFDWPDQKGALAKIDEEVEEFKTEIQKKRKHPKKIKEEFGDILFSLVNLARKLNIDAEDALQSANNKFIDRFGKMEKLAKVKAENFTEYSIEELEALWQKAKKK